MGDKNRGLYAKFKIMRTDGKDAQGDKTSFDNLEV